MSVTVEAATYAENDCGLHDFFLRLIDVEIFNILIWFYNVNFNFF